MVIFNKIKNKYIMKTKIIMVILFAMSLTSCTKYDDFTNDYEYTAVYFAYQNPIRTLFANNLNLEVGVVLGGKRENNKQEEATFRIAPELLSDPDIVGSNNFTLLPENYYTLGNPSRMIIKKGELIGTVSVNIDESFLSDPLATQNTYALPFLLTETSADSILSGDVNKPRKDYTILLIKYINEHHGVYYHRGVRKQYDAGGALVDELSYASNLPQEFVQNIVWNVNTVNATTLKTNGVAEFTTGSSNTYSLILTHAVDDKVSITAGADSQITNIIDNGNSLFDKAKKAYYLNYEYTDTNNRRNVMVDTLFFRNDGLKLELW
jgi:hypothetical protein